MQRAQLNRWRHLHPAPPVVRYEHPAPGDLLHLDIKGMTRYQQVSIRGDGRRHGRPQFAGWQALHVAIDDHSRLAFSRMLPNQQTETAIVFLRAAVAFYAQHGISIRRLLTDNGSCYRSRHFRTACLQLGIPHRFTRPYTPRTNGKAERFIQTALREWAYVRHYLNSEERHPISRPGSSITTSTVPMLVSVTRRPSAGLLRRVQRLDRSQLTRRATSARSIAKKVPSPDTGMTPRIRKLTITAHVAFSVGWLGATAAFLVLSIAGIASHDAEVVRGAYLSMDLISRFVIIPLSLAALATGLLQALGTPWGLFRYYWVLVKFGIAIFATTALLVHELGVMAEAARLVSGSAPETLFSADFLSLKTELVRAPSLAIVLLFALTTLGVYKPWGLTQYGRRKQQVRRGVEQQLVGGTPLGVKLFFSAIGAFLLVVIMLHLTGHGFGTHHH